MSRVAVIGAGLAGLSSTFELVERAARSDEPAEVICLEAGERPGGTLRTGREKAFLYEWGPHGFVEDRSAMTVVRRLGLGDELMRALPAATSRFVYTRDKLRPLPDTPAGLLRSGVLPITARLRAAIEPLVPAARSPTDDESIRDFAARRLGAGFAEMLADCLVSDRLAGDISRLSLQAAFPHSHELETRHGSLWRALRSRQRSPDPVDDETLLGLWKAPRLASFRNGMQELTDALASAVGSRLRLEMPVERLSDLGVRGFRLHLPEGAPLEVDAVVLACPASSAARVVTEMDPELAEALDAFPTAPLATVHFGYRRDALPPRPDGYGMLVPRQEGLRMLGSVWISDVFDGRAPEGSQLLSTRIGGAHDPEAGRLDDRSLVQIAREELHVSLGILPDPYFIRVVRHEAGVPQYELGHRERLARVDALLERYPGLELTGASYRGLSVNACLRQSQALAERILAGAGRTRLTEMAR